MTQEWILASELLVRDKIEHGMVLMARVYIDDSEKRVPVLECLHTKLLHYPPDENEDKEVGLERWHYNGRKWILYK